MTINNTRFRNDFMPRALWKGTLGFGLVSISVELLTAERADELDLDLLDRRDNARIGYLKINKSTQQPVPQEEIVRGFAMSDDRYVILTDEDLKSANPKATQSIDIFGFVGDQDVPRLFFAKPYFVSPLKGSDRAYALLRDVLAKSGQLALATVVIHTRQHVAAVYPHDGALVVQLLRYAADIKSPDDAGVKDVPSLTGASSTREVAMAQQLLSSMADRWQPETYRDDVMKLIAQRSKKGGTASPAVANAAEPATKVLDLVAALQRSLASGSKRAPASSRTDSASKRASAKRGSASVAVISRATAKKRETKRAPSKKSRGRVA